MRRGILLTTGAEFVLRDAIKTPALPGICSRVRSVSTPSRGWGACPCTPDTLPIIGKSAETGASGSHSALHITVSRWGAAK
jgi:hypothetical protein